MLRRGGDLIHFNLMSLDKLSLNKHCCKCFHELFSRKFDRSKTKVDALRYVLHLKNTLGGIFKEK